MSNKQQNSSVCIICDSSIHSHQANTFANQYQLPLFNKKNNAFGLQLIFSQQHIELFDNQLNTSIYVDFINGTLAHRQQFGGGRGQAIAKAIGLKKGKTPNVLDVTAGLGRDAFILATLGCHITLVEKSPILSLLLEDGITRARDHEPSAALLSNHFNLHNQDSVDFLQHLSEDRYPDVIYLDPMYPERKKSALVKKDMQILQRLLDKTDHNNELFETALHYAKERIVVKRPNQAPFLTEKKPATSIHSKKTRFDIYFPF